MAVKIPPPAGEMYTAQELAKIMGTPLTSTTTAGPIAARVNLILASGCCPVGKTRLYELGSAYRLDPECVVRNFGQLGRSRKVPVADLTAKAIEVRSNFHATVGAEHVVQVAEAAAERTAAARGVTTYGGEGGQGGAHVSPRTVSRNLALISSMPGSRTTGVAKLTKKTESRFISEHSVRGAVSHVLTVSTAAFIIGPPPANLPWDYDKDSELSEMISAATGGAGAYPIAPALHWTTDDTTTYAVTTEIGDSVTSHWARCADNSTANGQTSDYARVGRGKSINLGGLKVRATHSFSADGRVASLYIAVTGLTEREMPLDAFPTGVHVVEIPGFRLGGTHASARPGHVAFTRQAGASVPHATPDCVAFQHYLEDVTIPAIDDARVDLGYTHVDGGVVPAHLRAVSWGDGHDKALSRVGSEHILTKYSDRGITAAKHHAAATGTVQPADRARTFSILKQDSLTTRVRTSAERALMASANKAFDSIPGLSVKSTKLSQLAHFTACYPGIMLKAAAPSTSISGFVSPGLLDRDTETTPSFKGMCNTLQRAWTVVEMATLRQNFAALLQLQYDQGHLKESDYDSFGFAVDRDSKGNFAPRPDAISSEHRHRAKVMGHQAVRDERAAVLRAKAVAVADTATLLHAAVTARLQDNTEIEAELWAVVKQTKPASARFSQRMLGDATADSVNKLTVAKLKTFVVVRKSSGSPNWNSKWGTLKPDIAKLAYDLRAKPITLKAVAPPAPIAVSDALPAPSTSTAASGLPIRASTQPKASLLLADSDWVKLNDVLVGGASVAAHVPDSDRADALALAVVQRLDGLLGARCADGNHWTFDWFIDAVPGLAAAMELQGLVRRDMGPARAGDSLLAPADQFMLAAGDHAAYGGAYVFVHTVDGSIVRTGKANGAGGFAARLKAHASKAMLTDVGDVKSGLYTDFPSKSSPRAAALTRRSGYFENLSMRIALGFDRDSADAATKLCGDLFYWPQDVLDRTAKLGFKGCTTLQEKQLHLLSYAFELFSDLAVGADIRASRSAGFELPRGQFPV